LTFTHNITTTIVSATESQSALGIR